MESESEMRSKMSGQRRVGLLYDERMCNHHTPDGDYHPETPNRIRAIWNNLQTSRITDRCVILDAKEAEDKYLLSVHSQKHVNLIKNISSKQFASRRHKIASKLNSIYFNEGSSEAAYLAAGSAVEVVKRVASRELHSAVAIVRPPGHHAEQNEAMGFCLFNNVAIAASYLLDESPEFGVKKILIVDWDVHHGNGTQKMFWNDSRVLFFSVHRHEFGSFYPANDDGFYNMIGEGAGAGYNINVPWENGRCGDADYFAVWDHILLPVTKEFNPDIILVSAGFDAAVGDPLGGCRVTPFGYSVMLKKLMNFAEGRIILVLEGGYNLDSIAKSMHACLEVLLEDKPLIGSSEAYPFESTWRVIQAVRQELSPFWHTLACELPQKLICQMAPPPHTLISSSDSETEDNKGPLNSENPAELLQDVIKPLSKLKVDTEAMGNARKLALFAKRKKEREAKEAKERAVTEKEARKQVGASDLPPTPDVVFKEAFKVTGKPKQAALEEQSQSQEQPFDSQASAGPVTLEEPLKRARATSDEENSNKRAKSKVSSSLDKGRCILSEETPKKQASDLPSCFQVKEFDRDLQEYYFSNVDEAFLRDLPFEKMQEMLLQAASWAARIVSTLLWYRQLEVVKDAVNKQTVVEKAEFKKQLAKARSDADTLKKALFDEKIKTKRLDDQAKDYEDKLRNCANMAQEMRELGETIQRLEELLSLSDKTITNLKAEQAKLMKERDVFLLERDTFRKEKEVLVEKNITLSADVSKLKAEVTELDDMAQSIGDEQFANAIAQIQLLNPGLNLVIEGMTNIGMVKDSRIVHSYSGVVLLDPSVPWVANIANAVPSVVTHVEPQVVEGEVNVVQIIAEAVVEVGSGIASRARDEETDASSSWRSELSNVYVWYASYGSNMWKERFYCYIAGGQVEGMQKPCSGSVNKTLPNEVLWKTVPCHIFFGRDSSFAWGPGGVAFLNPERNFQHNTYMCLYKISLEQFNDVLFQENALSLSAGSPLFDITTLNAISNKEFSSQEVVKGGWYGNVVYLGKEQDIPIITMTCSLLDIERFKSGKLPLRAPNKSYANILIKGLVEGEQLSEAEAIAHIEAAAKSL